MLFVHMIQWLKFCFWDIIKDIKSVNIIEFYFKPNLIKRANDQTKFSLFPSLPLYPLVLID